MKRRLNVIDIFIIFAAVLTIVGIGVRVYINKTVENADIDDYIISLSVNGVSAENSDFIKVGDSVTRKDDGLILGTVSDVSWEYQKSYVINNENQYTEMVDNSKINITVKVKALGKITDEGFSLNGEYYLSAGMNFTFETVNFEGRAIIMDISTEK